MPQVEVSGQCQRPLASPLAVDEHGRMSPDAAFVAQQVGIVGDRRLEPGVDTPPAGLVAVLHPFVSDELVVALAVGRIDEDVVLPVQQRVVSQPVGQQPGRLVPLSVLFDVAPEKGVLLFGERRCLRHFRPVRVGPARGEYVRLAFEHRLHPVIDGDGYGRGVAEPVRGRDLDVVAADSVCHRFPAQGVAQFFSARGVPVGACRVEDYVFGLDRHPICP